jgi:excisionase family DNA binding protein
VRTKDVDMTKQRELTLQQAADRLGVHYMTVYRYVRTGRLAGRRERGEWRVPASDVDALADRPGTNGASAQGRGKTRGGGRGNPRWSEHAERLRTRLVSGDEAGAWQVLERVLVGGADPAQIYVRVLAPAMRRIGELWSSGELTVEDEHRATAVAGRLIGRLGPRFARPGRHRGTVVLGAAPGDTHALPTAMLADVARGARYAVVDLGGSTPFESFVSAASEADSLVAVGVSASTADSLETARSVLGDLRAVLPEVPLLLGGPAVKDEAAAREAGADAWASDATDAVRVIEAISG